MYCSVYLKKETVLIPTLAQVRGGPLYKMEPVAVVAVSDTEALRRALRETIARGNPVISKIPDEEPVLYKYAGLKAVTRGGKRIAVFQRSSLGWSLVERDGFYRIERWIEKKGYRGGKVTDPNLTETFPPGTSVEVVIDRMIAILQSAAKE